jgi:dTDP-glucose 4,6-dehydratase/UDP-glucose 4-epimerase
VRDFNYVDDVVDALLLAALSDKANGEIFNLGSSEVVNLKDLAQIMSNMHAGGRYEIVPFPPERKAIDIGDYYSDFAKIKNALGWQPKIGLHEGLGKSLDYYRQYHTHYWEQA